jgi:hypothetical protein
MERIKFICSSKMIKLNLCKIDSYQKIKAMYAPVRLCVLHGMCCELKVIIRDVRNQQKILVFFSLFFKNWIAFLFVIKVRRKEIKK